MKKPVPASSRKFATEPGAQCGNNSSTTSPRTVWRITSEPGVSTSSAPNAVVNPTILVEVTSKSTEDYDRGEKLNHYKQCPSVELVLIISHRRPQVTLHKRSSAGWEVREYRAGEFLEVASPEFRFGIDELFSGIELDSE